MVPNPFNDGINIVGLMLLRNEQWVIRASARAALQWCDQLLVYADRCTDSTVLEAAAADMELNGGKPSGRVMLGRDSGEDKKVWNEMDMRQYMLGVGRAMSGTHFAIVDGDEILTADQLPNVRGWFKSLAPGQLLEVPMVPVWRDPHHYRSDRCVWSNARLTLGWRDTGKQGWKAREDGYQHHARAPFGIEGTPLNPIPYEHGKPHPGGVMHLQFGNQRRLLAKHVLYRMVDHLRWPGRRTPNRLNQIYDEALEPALELTEIPETWKEGYRWGMIDVNDVPWQEAEIAKLIAENGRDAFLGLDLKGF